MSEEPQKTLIDHYSELPEDVQKAIFSAESAEIIQKVGQDHKLNVRQIGILADETGLLMLGINPPSDFVKNLNKRLETDKEATQKIAQEINTRIFAKIRESLRKLHDVSSSEDKKGDGSGEIDKTAGEPISRIIKPRTAPFVVSSKNPEMEEVSAPAEAPTPAPKTAPDKNVIEERKKEEGFRSKPSFTEVKLPPEETGKKEVLPKKPIYKGGADPYREPLD